MTVGRAWRRFAVIAGVVWLAGQASPVTAQTPPSPPVSEAERAAREAEREELKEEIRRYTELVQAMRESLAVREGDPERRREFEKTVQELSTAVSAITEQLADLELDVADNRVRLRDGRGGEVTLDIPENLPEKLSAGLSEVARMLMEEMPDTVRFGDRETGFTWRVGERGLRFSPVARPQPRRVIEGGLVKIRDDMEVASDEDVYGDAVAVMGDALVAGRVRGDVVAVLGDVQLAETAMVDGRVIAILGTVDRAEGAETGAVTVVSPGGAIYPDELHGGTRGWVEFGAYQSLFVILLVMVLLLAALTPATRREALVETGRARPGQCAGLGLLLVLIGHVVVLGLVAILVLTVIGIPVALLALAAVALVDLGGVGAGSLVIGRTLCARWGFACPRPWREVTVGMLVLHAASFVAALLDAVAAPIGLVVLLAAIGGLLKLTVFCFGLGALFLSRFGARRRETLPAPPFEPLQEHPGT